jgi:hypothetical protein
MAMPKAPLRSRATMDQVMARILTGKQGEGENAIAGKAAA